MRTIELTQGQVALVDDEDFERLSTHKWFAYRNNPNYSFYARRNSPRPERQMIHMHHEIMGGRPQPGFEIDHVDGDGLNNQKNNLREATHSQNQGNQHRATGSSTYKGVYYDSGQNGWCARIQFEGKRNFLGRFASEEDAARAYDAAALEHFGEFAGLNFAA